MTDLKFDLSIFTQEKDCTFFFMEVEKNQEQNIISISISLEMVIRNAHLQSFTTAYCSAFL